MQGACIAGGLMLCWPCDLIVAADDAWFSDPVARMGIGGVEYHGHTWELGARKAKEFLFTGKRAVNQTLDIMGFQTALQSVFDIHEMGHGAMWSRRSEGESRGSALERMKERNQEIAQRQRTETKA